MFPGRFFCCYFLCVLTGVFAFLQQAEGIGVGVSSHATETDKNYFFYQNSAYPRDCKEVVNHCWERNSSGVFVIKPDGYPHPFEVYCNNSVDSGGWTVVMRRLGSSLVFSRNWTEYKEGFGFLNSEFWLGNEKLAFLTNQQRYELRIDVTVLNGSRAFMKYSYFRVSDEWGNYALTTLGNPAGNTDFLVPICPTNMIHTNCTCERTCKAPDVCQNNCRDAFKCVCPEGFFLKGSNCVPPEVCECYLATAGKVIPVDESYINSQCSQKCSCSKSGLTCSNYGCDPNARCKSTSEGGVCTCNKGFVGDGQDCGCDRPGYLVDGSSCRRPRDCGEVPSVEGYSGSGLYYIMPSNWQEFQVYCNMSEGQWTVFQRRISGSRRDFKLSWDSYKRGFGELEEDFWLGNDKIYYLTSQGNYQLRIDIIDSGNRHYKAQYDGFRIGNEGNKYRMTVLGTYSGNAGYDAMRDHLNQPFSTYDRDNDDSEGDNCYEEESISYWDGDPSYSDSGQAGRLEYRTECNFQYNEGSDCSSLHEGAWWYKRRARDSDSSECDRYTDTNDCCDGGCSNCRTYSYSCAFSNLNGKENGARGKTIFWHGLSGNDCGIKFTEMKLRPV